MLHQLSSSSRTLINQLSQPRLIVVRSFAAKDRARERRLNFDKNRQPTAIEEKPLPEFSSLLRQLYKRAHPDVLRSANPELASYNDDSMQTLNGILSTIKTYNEYPAQIIKTIPFHLKTNDGRLERVDLRIRTAGGDCKRQLTVSFSEFFVEAGIYSEPFTWPKDYFPMKPKEGDLAQHDA